MKRLLLILAAALLPAGSAFAQETAPGQDRAAPSTAATSTEKATAKVARKAAGTTVSRTARAGDDQPGSTAQRASKSERKAAAAKRKAHGVRTVKAPKEVTGTNN